MKILAQSPANQRPHRQVGHVVVIHHIEMDDIGARFEHGLDLPAQAGEIGGKDGRRDAGAFHGPILKAAHGLSNET